MIDNKKIALSAIIALVQSNMGYEGDTKELLIRSHIYMGLRALGTGFLPIKEACIALNGACTVKKPCDMAIPKAIALKNGSCCVKPTYNSTVGACDCNTGCSCEAIVTEHDCVFLLNNNARQYQEMEIVYYAYTDMSGDDPMLLEAYTDALVAYATWKLVANARGKQNNARSNNIRVTWTLTDMAFWKNEWHEQRKYLNGLLHLPVEQGGVWGLYE